MTNPATPVRPDVFALLEENCTKLRHGRCLTVRCCKRGGYVRGEPFDESMSTCEYLEIDRAIKAATGGAKT